VRRGGVGCVDGGEDLSDVVEADVGVDLCGISF